MNNDHLLHADVLDIIFAKRNQQYGAYTLRKFYNNRLFKAFLIMLTVCAVLVYISLVFKTNTSIVTVPDILVTKAFIPETPKAEPQKPKQPKPAAPELAAKTSTQKFVSTLLITKDTADKLSKNMDSAAIGSFTDIKAGYENVQLVQPALPGSGDGNGVVAVVQPVSVNRDIPLAYAEIMPAYPGGMQALRKFLEKNLHSPQDLDEGQVISVQVRFIVGYDGALKGFEVLQDGGQAYNDEVIRVLKKMPVWVPGKSKGTNVSVFYTIPVKFAAGV